MTINEINRKINALNKLLENEKRKANEKKAPNVGCYYKLDNYFTGETIGKIKSLYDSSAYDYICDEVYFDTDYNELRNEEEYRSSSHLVFINKEEFNQILEKMINKLKSKF